MTNIFEAKAQTTMTPIEKKWHKKLINMLKDDGKGHKHGAYAAVLENFILNIIPAKDDPSFTASVSFDDSIIRISSGFLEDESTFYQLNVLLRHELAHALMMHQVRMMKKIIDKYGKDGYTRISFSQSLHSLQNVITDYEISNKRYSEADKETVRNMWLNGRVIGGLVTEDNKSSEDWSKLSIEDMYDKLEEKIEEIQTNIVKNWNWQNKHFINPEYTDKNGNKKIDQVVANIDEVLFYNDVKSPTNFIGNIKQFIDDKALYHFFPMDRATRRGTIPALFKMSSLPKDWQSIIKALYDRLSQGHLLKQDARDMIVKIAQVSPSKKFDIIDPKTGDIICDVITPEEKLVAIDTIKAMIPTLESYKTWFEKVQKVLGDSKYSKQDVEKIFNSL